MKTYKLKIKNGKTTLHAGKYDFYNYPEANSYALGLCEGLRLSGMNPNKMILKQVKDSVSTYERDGYIYSRENK